MTTCHVIRKDGLLYKLAYRGLKEEDRPTGNVNLCDTVWSAMISMVGLISVGLFFIVFACLAAIAVVFIGSLVWLLISSIIAWLADLHLQSMSHQDVYMVVGVGSAIRFRRCGNTSVGCAGVRQKRNRTSARRIPPSQEREYLSNLRSGGIGLLPLNLRTLCSSAGATMRRAFSIPQQPIQKPATIAHLHRACRRA